MLSSSYKNLIFLLKAGCVKVVFPDTLIGRLVIRLNGVVKFGFYAVNSSFARVLEHNAKRYSLFITENPRT
jgi:hypothetical protein